MDSKAKNNWSWLPLVMPGVASMMKEKRALFGDAHVDECWRRGVVLGQPGWFFAREGAVSVGTPASLCDELDQIGCAVGFPRAPMLMLAEPAEENSSGAD